MAQAAATRYAADVNASTQRYVASVNASTQRWVTSANVSASILNTQASNASRERQVASTNATNLAIQKSRETISAKDRKTSTINTAISSGGRVLSSQIGALGNLASIATKILK